MKPPTKKHLNPARPIVGGLVNVDGVEVELDHDPLDDREQCIERLGIDALEDLLHEGMSVAEVARQLKIPSRTLWDWIDRDPVRAERVRATLQRSAHAYAQMAADVLRSAPNEPAAIAKARELAQHYRWMARVLHPRVFGDRTTHEHEHKLSVVDALKRLDREAEQR